MSLIENGKNPYLEMSNEKLAFEIGRLEMYGNLSGYAQKLLSAAKIRLEGNSDSTATDTRKNTKVVGIDLAAVVHHNLALVNLVKDAVYGLLQGKPDTGVNRVCNQIVESIGLKISAERLATAQVFLEIKQIDEAEGVKWRVLVDIPVVERRGEFVRHYISKSMYYAYSVQLIAENPDFAKVQYSTIPPSWTSVEVFTNLLVNFDDQVIKHEYKTSGVQGTGVYLCEMNGDIRQHYVAGTHY
jgi:hypothetical protein